MAVSDVALTRRWHDLLNRLAAQTGIRVASIWNRLDNHAEDDFARFARLTHPVVGASQRQAIRLTVAYLSRVVGGELAIDLDAALERAAVNLREPFIAFGRALNDGLDLQGALDAGSARSVVLGEAGPHWAARAASTEIDAGEERIIGWTRVLAGGSCDWCAIVAGQDYRTAESASFGHTRCNCGVAPIVGDRNPGHSINRSILEQHVTADPGDDGE